jgi:hypothetical protein
MSQVRTDNTRKRPKPPHLALEVLEHQNINPQITAIMIPDTTPQT